jgi:hypothetical protein
LLKQGDRPGLRDQPGNREEPRASHSWKAPNPTAQATRPCLGRSMVDALEAASGPLKPAPRPALPGHDRPVPGHRMVPTNTRPRRPIGSRSRRRARLRTRSRSTFATTTPEGHPWSSGRSQGYVGDPTTPGRKTRHSERAPNHVKTTRRSDAVREPETRGVCPA